jgi:hypothetical protein
MAVSQFLFEYVCSVMYCPWCRCHKSTGAYFFAWQSCHLLPIFGFYIYFGIESLKKFLKCQAYFGENKTFNWILMESNLRNVEYNKYITVWSIQTYGLWCCMVWYGRSLPAFQRNELPPFSFSCTEDGCCNFLQNFYHILWLRTWEGALYELQILQNLWFVLI